MVSLFHKTTFIEKLFFTYLLIFPFYVPLQNLIYDTPWWRDAPVSLMISMLIVGLLMNHRKFTFNVLDVLMLLYFLYGTIFCISKNIFQYEVLVVYRKYFFPVLLYFVAKYIFFKKINYSRFYKSVIILFILLTTDIIISNTRFNLSNTQNNYVQQDSFVSIEDLEKNYTIKEIGIQRATTFMGDPHITVLLYGGLGLFLYPFFTYYNKKRYYKNSRWYTLTYFKYSSLWLLGLFSCIFVSGIKLVIISTLFIILIYTLLFFDKKRFTYFIGILSLLIVSIIVLFNFLTGFSGMLGQFIYLTKEYFNLEALNLLLFFTQSDLSSIITGIFPDTHKLKLSNIHVGRSEIRLIVNTIDFGLVWLLLYLTINLVAIQYCYKYIKQSSVTDKPFFVGCFGIIILYFSDTLHYGLSLMGINFDIWLVVLAAISSSKIYLDGKSKVFQNINNLYV